MGEEILRVAARLLNSRDGIVLINNRYIIDIEYILEVAAQGVSMEIEKSNLAVDNKMLYETWKFHLNSRFKYFKIVFK